MKNVAYILFLMLSAGPAIVANDVKTEKQYGTITGSVVLSDRIAPLKLLFKAGEERVKDAKVCCTVDMPDERLVFHPVTNGVQNVFVWIHRFKAKDTHPDLTTPQPATVRLTVEGCRYRPHGLCVQPNQTFNIGSKDPLAHNPHSYTLRNQAIGCLIAPFEDSSIHNYKYSRENFPFAIKCDYHPWMNMYVLVQDHPYMTITDADGAFKINKLPYGEHQLAIWHEATGYLLQEIVQLNQPKLALATTQFELTDDVRESLGIAESPAQKPTKEQ